MNSKIKVISLSTTYPESSSSTKGKFVHSLNKELVKLGLEIKVITPHSKGIPKKLELDSIRIHFFKYLPEKLEMTKSIPDEAKTVAGKFKIVFMLLGFFLSSWHICSKKDDFILHGHWAFPAGYLAYFLSKRFKKKFIVSVHGSEIALLQKYGFLKKISANALNNSFKVIAGTDFLKNQLLKLGVNENKIVLIRPIPNFIEHVIDDNELAKFRDKFTSVDKKIILFVGRLTEVKGTEYLLKSLKFLKNQNFHCIIVGGGILEIPLKKLSSSLGVSDKVTFFGPANSRELGFFYNISDVFVMPSIVDSLGGTEGTGLVIPEAMESNLPVVASNVGGIPEIIQNEVNGLLVNQKDPKAIAEAVERILSDNTLRENIIKNSKNTVEEFSPQSIAKKYYEIFSNISK